MSTLTDVAAFFHRPSPQILSGLTKDKGPIGDLARTFAKKKQQLQEKIAADNGINLDGELPDETVLSEDAETLFRELGTMLDQAPRVARKAG
ncbi:hypothetical protein KJ713_01435 [Patescibacteria group bacterium]|nr:hypothetical protein [Patescibacteria group bacterium]